MMKIPSANNILFLVGVGLVIGLVSGISIATNGKEPIQAENDYSDVDGGIVFSRTAMELIDESKDAEKLILANNSEINLRTENHSIIFDGLIFSNDSVDALVTSYYKPDHPLIIAGDLGYDKSIDAGNYTIERAADDTLKILLKEVTVK